MLRSAYESCLTLAVEYRLRSIAFPAISTGVYGYPFAEAAEIAVRTAWGFTSDLDTIIFCCFREQDAAFINLAPI